MGDATEASPFIILTAPRDLAEKLINEAGAAPYLRTSRADPALFSAVIVAAATAGTTVIVTGFSKAIATRVASVISRWFHGHAGTAEIELVIESDGFTVNRKITMKATDTTDTLVRLLEAASKGDLDFARQSDD